jgi:hypothetical protein
MNRLASLMLLSAALMFSGCSSDEPSAPLSENPLDETPPLTPSGFALGQQGATKFALVWSQNSEPDLSGYRVYLYRPDPERAESYVCLTGAAPLSRTSTVCAGDPGTTYYFRISAVDASGNESVWSQPYTFTFVGSSDDLPTEEIGGDESFDTPGSGGGPKELPADQGMTAGGHK